MRQKSNSTPASSETLVRNIRRATRKHHAAEEKIRIVLDGLRGETSIADMVWHGCVVRRSGTRGDRSRPTEFCYCAVTKWHRPRSPCFSQMQTEALRYNITFRR